MLLQTSSEAGGLVGSINSGDILRSYSIGSVSGRQRIAGIAGFIVSGNASGIEDSYSLSNITATASSSNNGLAVGNLNDHPLGSPLDVSKIYYLSSATCTNCNNTHGNAVADITDFYDPNVSLGFTWNTTTIWEFVDGELPRLRFD